MTDEKKPDEPRDADPNPDPERTERMSEPGRDWSSFEGDDLARRVREARRAAHEQAREAERMARESERMAREADRMARDTERQVRDQMRAQFHAEREREREARREERQARREEWRGRRHVHIETDIPNVGFGFEAGDFAKKFMKDFVSDATGDSYSETVSGEFTFERMPRLHIRNVSGETRIKIGEAGKITVTAKKQVTAGSEDRAKRLLQNLEIRMEKSADDLRIEPHLYEQERSWVDLFRGKRFRVDFDITVPQECGVDAQTVSGDVMVSGIHGPLDLQTVSADVTLEDAQGPLRLKSVSGDIVVRRYVGHVEGNTVSGDVAFDGVRIRSMQLHTVSGDVNLKGALEPAREHRFRTISGDIELGLAAPDLLVDFHTASGDLECDIPSQVNRQNRKEYTIGLGDARGHAIVKTVSGDLTIRGSNVEVPGEPTTEEPSAVRTEMRHSYRSEFEEAEDETDVERTEPMDPEAQARVRGVLEKLAKGEIGVDDAASALDEARKSR